MRKRLTTIFAFQQLGLLGIILLLGIVMTAYGGSHTDFATGKNVNNFLNPATLLQVATDTSFIAIMAVGMMTVIISAGIDLSVGSIYAFSGVLMALLLRYVPNASPIMQILGGVVICCGTGMLTGLLNGVMVSRLGVHPFIITLGTMWAFRGISFVATKGQSILVPTAVNEFARGSHGLSKELSPIPLVVTLVVTLLGALYLQRTTWGRRVFAVGGNVDAARYSGLRITRILTNVYVLSGLCAGIAAFVGAGFFGSASSGDGTGYELYVIASAVVGGASLNGGKGTAIGALLGALLIQMIRQSIRTLHWDQNYEQIVIGIAIIVAVVFDRWSRTLAQRRMVGVRN